MLAQTLDLRNPGAGATARRTAAVHCAGEIFATLEDETGTVDSIVWPSVMAA